MPFRQTEFTAKMQFLTSSQMPALVAQAAKKRGLPSSTAYLQQVVAEALSKELDIPLEEITSRLPRSGHVPPPKSRQKAW